MGAEGGGKDPSYSKMKDDFASAGAVRGFKDWTCSFSGCDGGRPEWPIWICGIESGYSRKNGVDVKSHENEMAQYYLHDLPSEIAAGAVSLPTGNSFDNGNLDYGYVLKAAKLCSVVQGKPLGEARANAMRDFGVVRLNLYPIAMRSMNDALWDENRLARTTGLATKELYRAWCFLHRFPWLAQQVRKHGPALVIGTGTGLLTDFLCAFGSGGEVESIHREKIVADGTGRWLYWTKVNSKTILAVTPFLGGPSGLNSDALLAAFGKRLAELIVV